MGLREKWVGSSDGGAAGLVLRAIVAPVLSDYSPQLTVNLLLEFCGIRMV